MRIIRVPEAEAKTGLCDRVMRDMEKAGDFPRRFTLNPGGRAVGYLESEIDEWIVERVAARDRD